MEDMSQFHITNIINREEIEDQRTKEFGRFTAESDISVVAHMTSSLRGLRHQPVL